MRYVLQVNGRSADVNVDPQTPLLTVLQHDLGLTGPEIWLRARAVRHVHRSSRWGRRAVVRDGGVDRGSPGSIDR